MEDDESTTTDSSQPAPSSVAHSVLEAFFQTLAETEGYAEVATRLRHTVFENESFAENAIKTAIFDDDSP